MLVCGTAMRDISCVLVVPVIAFAVVRATALDDLGPALVLVARRLDDPAFDAHHGSDCIN